MADVCFKARTEKCCGRFAWRARCICRSSYGIRKKFDLSGICSREKKPKRHVDSCNSFATDEHRGGPKELGISAVELNPNDTDMLTKISEGKFAVVLTSAEDSLNASFLKILKEENHNLSISLIVVDEVHTVETW